MPDICTFLGIFIALRWAVHNPPHIHVRYSGHKFTITLKDRIVRGSAPSKVIAKVNEWMDLHIDELNEMWEKSQKGEKLGRIGPLDR